MVVTALSGKASFNEVIHNGNVIIINFYSTWSQPCEILSPSFEKLSEEISGPEFYTVNVSHEKEIFEQVGIKDFPTFMVFKDGQKVGEVVGLDPEHLQKLVAQYES
ncbi:uncharacterized protein N7498_010664 [Penicillium cinerascens]|uniref:Thioredoxin n=1 Tax=Penicillium cinerascens TaxID=70096 RepID=A0A9W9M7K0_9EURO|nr:uncharacterized protein N7498_010664 [Penicillium cinerascens]KAJ5191679.1 hypothetical protein N7498_010664 [Penicillium cinerascens]